MRNYNHRRSSDKIWAQEGRLFRQKVVIFPSFSSVIMIFFSPHSVVNIIDFFSILNALSRETNTFRCVTRLSSYHLLLSCSNEYFYPAAVPNRGAGGCAPPLFWKMSYVA